VRSPPPTRFEHPWSSVRRVDRKVGVPSARRPIEIPVSASPAKGSVVAAIRMLFTSENPAREPRCRASRVFRLQSAPRYAAPPFSGGGVAIEELAPLLPLRTAEPAPDDGKPAKRLGVSGAWRLVASRTRTRRSAPEGVYDRFRSLRVFIEFR